MNSPSSSPVFWKSKRVLVTGGAGFIGSAVVRRLHSLCNVPLDDIVVPRSRGMDLRVFENALAASSDVQVVIHLAAVTGGSQFSRTKPATQYRESTQIDLNVIEAARLNGVERCVVIGNLFAYAEDCAMPAREEDLFNGLPGPFHRGVGLQKRNLAGLADLYMREFGFGVTTVLSANAYGPGDSLDPTYGHVIPSIIMKCLRDSELVVWGDGSAIRDFLFVDDIARGLLLAVERLSGGSTINIGSGVELSIRSLVDHIVAATGFQGSVRFDATQPPGDRRRIADVSKARELLEFMPAETIESGLARAVEWYRRAVAQPESRK